MRPVGADPEGPRGVVRLEPEGGEVCGLAGERGGGEALGRGGGGSSGGASSLLLCCCCCWRAASVSGPATAQAGSPSSPSPPPSPSPISSSHRKRTRGRRSRPPRRPRRRGLPAGGERRPPREAEAGRLALLSPPPSPSSIIWPSSSPSTREARGSEAFLPSAPLPVPPRARREEGSVFFLGLR